MVQDDTANAGVLIHLHFERAVPYLSYVRSDMARTKSQKRCADVALDWRHGSGPARRQCRSDAYVGDAIGITIDPCAANGPTASDETREVPETTNQPGGIGRAGINKVRCLLSSKRQANSAGWVIRSTYRRSPRHEHSNEVRDRCRPPHVKSMHFRGQWQRFGSVVRTKSLDQIGHSDPLPR